LFKHDSAVCEIILVLALGFQEKLAKTTFLTLFVFPLSFSRLVFSLKIKFGLFELILVIILG
jgi:hypothetical protein